MRLLVLEDEPPARDRLVAAVARLDPEARVDAALASVVDALAWLTTHEAPDLVLADIQLSDGLSFEVFERLELATPVVFCTAFDQYVLEAMAGNGIDYLLKPIRDDELDRALTKYRRLAQHFTRDAMPDIRGAAQTIRQRAPRQRILARRGEVLVTVAIDDVAYFAVQDKLGRLVTRTGEHYELDRTLAELEAELDPTRFFRLNRQYLAQASAVARVHPYVKGRLLVELVPATTDDVVVSQENAARLRTWLGG